MTNEETDRMAGVPAGAGQAPMPSGTATPSVGGGTQGDSRTNVGPDQPIDDEPHDAEEEEIGPDGTDHEDGGGV